MARSCRSRGGLSSAAAGWMMPYSNNMEIPMSLIVDVFLCRQDNYGYLVHDTASGRTAAIDAPDAGAIAAALNRRGWALSDIFVTHHHADHTDGIAELVATHGARVTGPRAEADKIAGLDTLVSPGDTVSLGDARFAVIGTPGHTLGHIAYRDAAAKLVFTGDALFSLGCGRMFEGTPGPMWAGLMALRALPDDTLVYCGHEYTLANARFALSVDPGNAALKARAAEAQKQRDGGGFTIPTQIGAEKQANPFLRADSPEIARMMKLEGAEPAAVFAALRKAKDNFAG
jgi:hydroxyacylglutathione hydrolase